MNKRMVAMAVFLTLANACLPNKGARANENDSTMVRLNIIVLETEGDSRLVLEKLRAGESFSALASQYSSGPKKQDGGDIGYVSFGKIRDELREPIGRLSVGEHSGMIKTSEGYFVVMKSAEMAQSEFQRLEEKIEPLDVLNSRIAELNKEGRYSEAVVIAREDSALAQAVFSTNDPRFGKSLNSLAELYHAQGRYGDAEPLSNRALAIGERVLGPDHPDVATFLNSLATLYRDQGRHGDAEPLYKRALAIREKAFGPDHPDVAQSLNNLGVLYCIKGRYAEAEALHARALAIGEKMLGPEHPDVALSLYSLATLYHTQGRYVDAEPFNKRALAIWEKALGPEHPDVATSLYSLAMLYHTQGRYADAEPLYKRSLAIGEKTLGPEHPDLAYTLNNLALLYSAQGRYVDAEPFNKRALAIWERALGPEHHNVATSINNLASLYHYQGRYGEAELLYKRSLAIREKALGPEHPDMAQSLNNLAVAYYDQGRYEDAEAFYARALGIREKALGPEHPDVAASLNSLATLYCRQGRYEEAEPLFKRALEIWEKGIGPEHPNVAHSLLGLATLYCRQGRYKEAEPLFKRALAIRERALGPEHPYVARSLNELAVLYYDQGRYEDAEPLYGRALSIREKALGSAHPDVANSLNNLALLNRSQGKPTDAERLLDRAFGIVHRSISENSMVLSEKNALRYAIRLRKYKDVYLSCHFDSESPADSSRERAAAIVLLSKGQVSDEVFSRGKSIVETNDSTLLALITSLRASRSYVSKLYVQGPGKDVKTYRRTLDSLAMIIDDSEVDLARWSAKYREYREDQNIDAKKVSSLLPVGSVLVEYLKYEYSSPNPNEMKSVPRYLALVVGRDEKLSLVDLGAASAIDSLVGWYRDHMTDTAPQRWALASTRSDYQRIGRALYDAIWKPLAELILGSELVFIAPDGALNLVSFAGLVEEEGKYLIEEYSIQYLSSGRDIVRLQHSSEPQRGLFALGDPDYDASPLSRLRSLAAPADSARKDEHYAMRNVRAGRVEIEEMLVKPLPGTRKEVKGVVLRWQEYVKEPYVECYGVGASEERFKAEAPGKRVIHLATHGYFLEGVKQPEMRIGEDVSYEGENPLLLSGLLFAGANLHGAGADSLGAEDGILTAYEVSAMDLEGTEMVVLSACETGLGKIEEGEGVYGLRRAFQMAGARTVISALWSVPDKDTAELMGGLYQRGEMTLPGVMRERQLEKLKKLRKAERSDHPFSWGAFITMGDWR